MDNKLVSYVSIISNGSITPLDSYIGEPDDKIIYKFIGTLKDPNKTKMSNKFIKKLINKIRIMNRVAFTKTERHMYKVKQYKVNDLYIIEYIQDKLKDRYECKTGIIKTTQSDDDNVDMLLENRK